MREQPANSALFPFIADAPTTTFQRIKALVTGSVPAFIEAGENFGGTEISEDNIVDQLVAKGGNATLLGDETWFIHLQSTIWISLNIYKYPSKDPIVARSLSPPL
jgi:predicted AlkP superfamily pyrophosphatase or phosphodiesterase